MQRCRKIYFRADAGADIGYGHFIRSLALADMLKNDFNCTFFSQIPSDYQRKEVEGICSLVELPSDDSKFQVFIDLLSGDEIVVLDNYFFTTDYQRQIKSKGCKLVCIDDMHDKHYVADIIINHGCDNPDLFSKEPYTRLCLGLEWALLRKPFLDASVTNKISSSMVSSDHRVESVVVCFGGSDLLNLTDKTIRILLDDLGIIRIDAIVGGHYHCSLSADKQKFVNFHRSISATEVADLFSNSDLAVVSASTACIEALACGVKTAAMWYVQNQKEFYSYLVRNNYIYTLGDLSNINLQQIAEYKIDLSRDFSKISKNYLSCFNSLYKIDFHIYDYSYVNYIDLPLSCHRVVWEVRNSEQIRNLMVETNTFSFNSHLGFVENLKTDANKIYWAVLKDSEFVGSISLHPINWETKVAEWGIFLNPKCFGKGIGKEIGLKFLRYILSSLELNKIEAKVKIDNIQSVNYHKNIGFELICKDQYYYYMEWK